MQKPIRHVSALVVALTCVAVRGQAPPGDRALAGPVPGFDISGYWTAAMHEDAEREPGRVADMTVSHQGQAACSRCRTRLPRAASPATAVSRLIQSVHQAPGRRDPHKA
jgi:hypothetical protein